MQSTPHATAALTLPVGREKASPDWLSAWPDALAFAIGLGVARWAGWTAGDLIWSLWLSSLVVGFATIVWIIAEPTLALTFLIWRYRKESLSTPRQTAIFLAILFAACAFFLAFFTVHFGGFHYIHSGFLLHFFPLDVPGVAHPEFGGRAVYLEVVRRYWVFLPSAFLSRRATFLRAPLPLDIKRWDDAFKNGRKPQEYFVEPYRNVLRMHGLIFFFAFAHFLKLDNFAVYTVIYAVYFFPWRLVRGER